MDNINASENFKYTDGLNNEQLAAVSHVDGPILVLAGAGTGKTKVLTTRIAHILSLEAAKPNQILAVTFTNKAANEMKARIRNFIGDMVDGMWIGTFHSIAARILRYHGTKLGLSSNFVIIDSADQLKVAKQVLKDAGIDEKQNPAKLMLYIIGRYKDKGWTPDRVPQSEYGTFAKGAILQLYTEYQNILHLLGALDFADLLLYNIILFNEHLDIAQQYQEKFKHVLVDEYQDTNVIQYLWLRLLVQGHHNICCVGDDDQAIYGWRGAEVTNILRFDKDFHNAKIVRLERNYRSTCHILDGATQLISNNKSRHGKILWTDEKYGEKIKIHSFLSDKQEARFVADEIDVLHRLHKQKLSEIAILVRASYQTRNFEESLNAFRIPYRIIGGTKFYERMEVKDSIAYIRLLVNLDDSLALERVLNVPKRGVGEATMQQIYEFARSNSLSLFASATQLIEMQQIKGKVAATISQFLDKLKHWAGLLSSMRHVDVVDLVLEESGYKQMWKSNETDEGKERLDNIKELINGINEFPDLVVYLEHISLVSDADTVSDSEKVNIMTMHAAKGLEFHNVFLPGWEEGLFPSGRTISESGGTGVEEERRLAYVAITRAKSKLYISYAAMRNIFGSPQSAEPSRFVEELPEESCENLTKKPQDRNISYARPTLKTSDTPIKTSGVSIKDSRCGRRVMHESFGMGSILGVVDNIAQVMFDNKEFKKISLDYLRILD